MILKALQNKYIICKSNMSLKMIALQRRLITGIVQTGLRNLTTTTALQKNYYETLGISRNATQAEIKNAYFEMSKLYHPDRIASTDENLAKFREISAAYEILGNEQSRKLYDRGLLGDLKKPIDEADEISDPIVKFYQKRQDLSRSLTQSITLQDEDKYVQHHKYFRQDTLKSEVRKKMLQKTYEELERIQEHPTRSLFMIVILAITGILFSSNFENTLFDFLWK